jgi:hypothetical protein
MKNVRQMLCKCEPAVTVTIIKLFAKYKAAPEDLLEKLLDTPRMRGHLSIIGMKLYGGMMSYEFWDRDSLYEEVWATPMAKLARKYGISDVGLAKVWRKLAIPVPGRGYWAKKEAGRAVQKLPLPALKEPVRLYKPTPKPEPP